MFLIINGPNLNLLGKREPEIYGSETFESYLEILLKEFPRQEIKYFQSNSEGEIIDAIHKAGFDPRCKGIVINPGAYSHYSIAIADAYASVTVPVVEVHVSNIHARETYRHHSVTAGKARGVITGLGLYGYKAALESLIN